MYIREIVLDGFKTYSQRTVIEGFDAHFNAITGMNGSGKSNILDAICFVLGIATLQSLRVNNYKELIYKNGHSGIVKANVSLVFDNTDKERSPEQYKKDDTITVRREVKIDSSTRYTMNGTKATQERVKQFFCMVGLNVNNATFVIMQGHITKVASHRPKEILKMIEEAAGIAMYERQKLVSERLLAKKESKLANINAIIDDELQPKISTLQNEKETYLQWKSRAEECTKLEEQLAYHEFHQLNELKENSAELLINYRKQQVIYEKSIESAESDIKKHQANKAQLISSIPNLTEGDEQLKKLQSEVDKINNEVDNQQDIVDKANKKLATIKKNITKLENAIPTKQGELTELNQKIDTSTNKIADVKEKIENISLQQAKGENSIEGHINNLEQQLQKAHSREENIKAEIEQLNAKIENERQNFKSTTNKQERGKALVDGFQQEIKTLTEELGRLEAEQKKRASLSNQERMSELKEQQRTLQNRLRVRQEEKARKNGDQFYYQQNIVDPGKVYGRLIRHITVQNKAHAQPLEVIAGNRLFAVVTDNDATAAQLL